MNIKKPIIEINRASVFRSSKKILKNISLNIFEGENVAILGPNGSGKSTLIKLICRELYPEFRKSPPPVKIFDKEKWSVWDLRKLVGLVSNDLQSAYSKKISGLDAVLSGFFGTIGIYDEVNAEQRNRAEEVVSFLEIEDLREKFLSKMSTGQLRKILIGRALVNKPRALILDEPTTGLDLKAKKNFLETLRKLSSKVTIILVTHHIDEIIPEINKVFSIKSGEIFLEGKKEDIITSENLSQIFDMQIEVGRDGEYFCVVYSKV